MTSVGDPAAGPRPEAVVRLPQGPPMVHEIAGTAGTGPGAEAALPPDWSTGAPPQYIPAEPDRFTRFITRLYERSPRWAAPLAALGCMVSAVGYTVYTDPTVSAPDAYPTCLLKLTTGLDCPGCGGTRAFWYVLNGDLPAAARHHIMFVFALPFLLYLYVAWAARHTFGWRVPQLRLSPTVIGGFLAAWMVFSVLRNLPWAPFTWLYV